MKSFQAVILAAILLLHSYSTSMSYSYSGKGGKSGGGKGGKSGSKGGKSDSYSYSTSSMSYGGGGCAWPLDQNLCWEEDSSEAIKFIVCPTADQEGNVVAEVYEDGAGRVNTLTMREYINSTAFLDQLGYAFVLVDDGTVEDELFGTYSTTYC